MRRVETVRGSPFQVGYLKCSHRELSGGGGGQAGRAPVTKTPRCDSHSCLSLLCSVAVTRWTDARTDGRTDGRTRIQRLQLCSANRGARRANCDAADAMPRRSRRRHEIITQTPKPKRRRARAQQQRMQTPGEQERFRVATALVAEWQC